MIEVFETDAMVDGKRTSQPLAIDLTAITALTMSRDGCCAQIGTGMVWLIQADFEYVLARWRLAKDAKKA